MHSFYFFKMKPGVEMLDDSCPPTCGGVYYYFFCLVCVFGKIANHRFNSTFKSSFKGSRAFLWPCVSVVRPSIVNFSHFRLLLWNPEQNSMKPDRKQYQCPVYQVCVFFSSQLEEQDGRPGLRLAETFSTFPLKPLNGIQRNLTRSKISMSSTTFVLFNPIEKQDGHPGLSLAETISTFSLKSLNRIQRNLSGSKISTSPTSSRFSGRSVYKNCRPGWSVK